MPSSRPDAHIRFCNDEQHVRFGNDRIHHLSNRVQSEDPHYPQAHTDNFIRARTIPDTVKDGQDAYQREDTCAQLPSHIDYARSHVARYPSATANDSPSGCHAPLVQNAPLPPSPPLPSLGVKTADPHSTSDLSPFLTHFEQKWNVREHRCTLLPRGEWMDAPAFLTQRKRKSCSIYFSAEGEAWDVPVEPRRDGRPLTVMDVITAIDVELYRALDPRDMFASHPRYKDAVKERPSRYCGKKDATTNTFRNVDLYPHRTPYFLGLAEEADGDGNVRYVVRMGAAPNV